MAGFCCRIDRARPARRGRRWRLPPAPATWVLVLVSLAVFAADHLASGGRSSGPVEAWGKLDAQALWGGAWWQVITSAFVHADFDHLARNMVALLVFGYAVEPAIGGRRLLFAYATTAAASSLAELLLEPGVSLGASAAVYGVAGVYLALLWRSPGDRWRWRTIGRRWLWTLLTLWFLAGTWGADGVGYIAHLAGLLAGLWYGTGLPVRRWAPRRMRRALRLRHAGLAVAITATAAVVAVSFWQPGWWLARAMSAARAGDWAAAQRHIFAVEACANPDVHSDALTLGLASALCLGHRDSLRARELLEPICPTLHLAVLYRKLGDLQSRVPPYREREAVANYRLALATDPEYAPAMGGLALLRLTAADSTLYDPQEALAMAKRAVAVSRGTDATYFALLAEAHDDCGDSAEAIRCMQEAVRLDPDRRHYRAELRRMRTEATDPPAAEVPGR